jgi:hypothetical protein
MNNYNDDGMNNNIRYITTLSIKVDSSVWHPILEANTPLSFV